MADQARRIGARSPRPELADFVVMKKDGIDGTARVHRRAFEKTWEPRGWGLVEEPPAETAQDKAADDSAARKTSRAPQVGAATSKES